MNQDQRRILNSLGSSDQKIAKELRYLFDRTGGDKFEKQGSLVIPKKEICLPNKPTNRSTPRDVSAKLMSNKVLDYVRTHPDCKALDISKALNHALPTVRKYLNDLFKQGKVEYRMSADGTKTRLWSIAYNCENPPAS